MAKAPEQLAHQEWLGYVQPVGLVVSIPALLAAQAHINRNIIPEHQRFLDCLPRDARDELIPELRDVAEFTQQVFGWRASDLESVPAGDSRYASIEVPLPEYNETLRPTHVVREMEPKDPQHPWMILIQLLPCGTTLDDSSESHDRNWSAPPQAKFERLLRETRVPIGLLLNVTHIRIVFAPRGETSGFATFSVSEMAQVAGRPIFAALHMLLCEERLFSLGEKQRLPAILADSRKYQNVVSTKLAEQVLAALYELVRGFQAADDQNKGELLREVLAENPNHVYQGLLTVLMRLVFVLYAEDRGLLSSDPIFANYYSLTGLFDRLRADDGRYPDTMDQRYGAWAQFLTLFRLIYEGGSHGALRIPPRHGYLFDPDRYNFLEGRPWKTARRQHDGDIGVPRISDGIVFRVLNNLLILDGERLSYRTLDVEQIGSVYETMMGFELEVAEGRSIALNPKKSHGAPATINLEALLAEKGVDRAKWLKENADQDVSGQGLDALKKATTLDELLAALDKKIAKLVTPNVVSKGAMVLQPSDERRKSGSHYTPRSLTAPIVHTTLTPILEQLGAQPAPDQILAFKVCDPAMGSGAFLVEACRQLGDQLVKSWHINKCVPKLPPDEDELLHARRLVAQRCLYGVDRNPMAVDLAKLSLWLVTLAKDHPFTFLDHSLRSGDSLVGLTRDQISGFHWNQAEVAASRRDNKSELFRDPIYDRVARATSTRLQIHAAGDDAGYDQQESKLAVSDEALNVVRMLGDAVVAAYFSADKDKARLLRLAEFRRQVEIWIESGSQPQHSASLRAGAAALRSGLHPITPFHWEIEFPEVFNGEFSVVGAQLSEKRRAGRYGFAAENRQPTTSLGFDAIVGNPPFAGKNTLINGNRDGYIDWLKTIHEESHGNADLVAHFFRRAFDLLRARGCFGLIATNTIGQGDTRSTGLRWICTHGGTIYAARKRLKWPGQAAVVVSVVNVCCGPMFGPFTLGGRRAPVITAYLFHAGGHDDPDKLADNERKSFIGSYVLGMGFTFDDTSTNYHANPLSLMAALVAKDQRNSERIFPFIGGEEVNDSPTHSHHRYVINFADFPLQRVPNSQLAFASDKTWITGTDSDRNGWLRVGLVPSDYPAPVAADWPDLLSVVTEKVKPQRDCDNRDARRKFWWRFGENTPAMYAAMRGMTRVLINSQVSSYLVFTFVPATVVPAHTTDVFTIASYAFFAVMQSGVQNVWGLFFASSLEDRLRYNTSDCFETFPLPVGVLGRAECDTPATHNRDEPTLETAGNEYYEFRAALMIRNNEGLTKTYNRFHDPHETSSDITNLRELHTAMDQTVLVDYGWHDLAQTATYEFLLEYEDDEDEEDSTAGSSPLRRHKKKPWRYRWPDDFRDEILARLLTLNAERAEQERLVGMVAEEMRATSEKNKGIAPKPSRKKAPKRKLTSTSAKDSLFERERKRFYIWMILRAWSKPVIRFALDAALVLMLNDDIRAGLLRVSRRQSKPASDRSVEGLDYILQEMETLGYIKINNSGLQQILTILPKAPATEPAPDEDLSRISEVKQIFARACESGDVVETEEYVDAKQDFIYAR